MVFCVSEKTQSLAELIRNASEEERENIFQAIHEREEHRKRQEEEHACEVLRAGAFPTPEDVRRITNSRVGPARDRILRNHPYWIERKLKEALSALIDAAQFALVDIVRHEAALAPYSSNWRQFEDHVQYTVSTPVQKDVMAFCSAAVGCIDTTRRLVARRSDLADKVKAIISENFTDDVAAFVRSLRNNLSHGSVAVPGWSVSLDRQSTDGHVHLNKDELLSFGDWSAAARRYVESTPGDTIGVTQTLRHYHAKLQRFSSDLEHLFATNRTSAEVDFYSIEDEYRRFGSRQMIKVLVDQVGKQSNPYDYLHRFFKPEQVRAILRLPNHSKEQVDYIISLKNVETDCDAALRKSLYRIFRVQDSAKCKDSLHLPVKR
jgi:hypothetical protein